MSLVPIFRPSIEAGQSPVDPLCAIWIFTLPADFSSTALA